MAWIEDISKRGQKSKHFYDSSLKQWKAELTIHDSHYKDEFNSWQDINENFEDDTGNFNKKCNKTRHAIHLSNSGNRRWYPRRNVLTEYVDIIGIEYWTGSQWRKLNLPTPVWTNNISEWNMSNLYAKLTNTWRSLKADFILKDSSAPTGLRYEIVFVGLVYNHETGELTSTTDGLVWGYIQKPIAIDREGNNILIIDSYNGTYIQWMVEITGALFPINIDPTFIDGYGGDVTTAKDTSINGMSSATMDRNYGAADIIWLDFNPQKGLIEFDLSDIDASATCDSATLYTYKHTSAAAETWTCDIYSIASGNANWPEGVLTGATGGAGDCCWNYKDQAATPTNWAGSAGLETSGTDYEASSIGSFVGDRSDAVGTEYSCSLNTGRVGDWFGTSNTNYGILLVVTDGRVPGVCSSDHATTGYRPKLVVTYTASGTTVNESVALGKILKVTQPFPSTQESVTLARSATIASLTQTNEKDGTSLARSAGITSVTQTNEKDAISLARSAGISGTTQTNEKDGTTLVRSAGISAEGVRTVTESVSLSKSLGIDSTNNVNLQDNLTLNRFVGISLLTQTNEKDGVSLGRSATIEELDQTNQNGSVSLERSAIISPVTQTNENDGVSLGRSNIISPVSQTNEQDGIVLANYIGITILEDTQGFINETVILARFAGIDILQEGISHVSENVNIDRLAGISQIDQLQISDSTTLIRSAGINEVGELLITDGLTLTRSNAINELGQLLISDGLTLTRSNGISDLELLQISDGIILNRIIGINEENQLQANDNLILNRLLGMDFLTQALVNDDLLLNKIIRITILEETQGNYSEIVTLDRFLGLGVLQEGISHVNESVNIDRLNSISIGGQSKIYDSLLFNRLNGITTVSQGQIFNNLLFSKSNGLVINAQSIVNENSTINKFNGLSTNSQIIVPEIVTLSQLYDLVILDSRYLVESVNLGYNIGLSLIDSPTIFESILLGKINRVFLATMLFGYDAIVLNQYKGIIAEPPSLYVYNDGNHSVAVLFRDKRAGVPFRDKRAGVPWRDKRSGK